jgi:hypothetical protein
MSPSRTWLSSLISIFLFWLVAFFPLAATPQQSKSAKATRKSKEPCNQSLIDQLPPATTSYIYPRVAIQPFYQWENNFGYCGEVSMIEAGLANGQWMSQYDARLVCGAGLGQAGPPITTNAWCSQYGIANYNAETLLEEPNTGVSGTIQSWGVMSQCAANMRLNSTFYPYQGVAAQQPANLCAGKNASSACPGYQAYMSWIKQQVILGYTVNIGVLIQNVATAGDQYDHEVPVVKIGTNHSPTDPTYYPDDVLYIEDHGVYWFNGTKATDNTAPEPPPGSGSNTTQCTPYIFGYTFSEMGATGSQASKSTNKYSIVLPANTTIQTWTGFNGNTNKTGGNASGPITGPNNYGVAVSGVMDTYNETVPVVLTASPQPGSIVGPTYTSGAQNPQDPLAGYDYEYPFIGTTIQETGCTNNPPSSWMTNFVLQATVNGLTPGVTYNLYEYQFGSPTSTDTMGTGSAAALAVPVTAFNANSASGASTPANQVTTFTASASSYVAPELTTTSDQIVVYRAVPAAPGLYSPVNGSTLAGTSATFAWDSSTVGPAVGATAYYLTVGSTQGGSQYYNSGNLPNTTFSETVTGLPSNGSKVWARWSYLVGGNWAYNDYSYTAP